MNKYSLDKDVDMVEDGNKQCSSREQAKNKLVHLRNLEIELKIINEEIRLSGKSGMEGWAKGWEEATMEMKKFVMTRDKMLKDWNSVKMH